MENLKSAFCQCCLSGSTLVDHRAGRYDDKLALLEATARHAPFAESTTLVDDQLALILGCCHPALDTDAQIALTLRSVAGLTTPEIAAAFLVNDATMGKRITRAKDKIRKANIPFVTPSRDELRIRLEAVLHVIYLSFTEGHSGTSSAELMRGDLCDEAIWLTDLLAELVPDEPEVLGLAALVRLTDARRRARLDGDGMLVLLEFQDRSLWDREQIDIADLDDRLLIEETIVHELSHVITLDPSVFTFGEVDGCSGAQISLGCAEAGSVLAEFSNRFWPGDQSTGDHDDFVNDYAASAAHEDLAESRGALGDRPKNRRPRFGQPARAKKVAAPVGPPRRSAGR